MDAYFLTPDNLTAGIQLMGYGMMGVFTVIVIFIGAIKLLLKVLPEDEEKDK